VGVKNPKISPSPLSPPIKGGDYKDATHPRSEEQGILACFGKSEESPYKFPKGTPANPPLSPFTKGGLEGF
jgi:hypothetical protein